MTRFWVSNNFIVKNCLFYFIVLLFLCCDKADDIGFGIQPNSDKIIISSYNDTSLFKLICVKEDSIKTDEVSANMLGSYKDPVFGNVSSGIALQYRLSSILNSSFGNNVTADSIILILPYIGHYGDTSQDMYINVSSLGEDIFPDSSYYSNQNFISSISLYSGSKKIRPNKDVYLPEDTLSPHLRINLDINFFEQNLLNTDISNLSSNENFISHFKGILIEPTLPADINTSIVYFNLLSSLSKIEVYYKNDSIYNIDPSQNLKYELLSDIYSARVNYFDLESNLDTSVFLGAQSMGGYKLKLEFLNLNLLDSLLDGKAINYINLTFYQDQSLSAFNNSNDLYPPHTQLSAVRIGDDDNIFFLDDYFLGTSHFGGIYNDDEKKYSFNISLYLQDLLSGDYANNGLYIIPVGSAVNANRTLFSPRVDMEIVYTKI